MEDKVQEMKTTRSNIKRQVTKTINAVKQHMAEGEKGKVKEKAEKLKTTFQAFDEACEQLGEAFEADDEKIENEDYFATVQAQYTETLNMVRKFLEMELKEEAKTPLRAEMPEMYKIVEKMQLPKVELEVFNGDPLLYRSFVAVFDEHVGGSAADDAMKLSRLLQFTSGRAKEAIRPCSLMPQDEGYKKAREILDRRFGNHHLISDLVMKQLKNGHQIRTAKELQEFSDDISNHYATLQSLKKLHEIDTQSCIVSIINRLQPYVRGRWKRYAMDQKREKDTYPKFKDLVDFIEREADDANDPVYSQVQASRTGGKSPFTMAGASCLTSGVNDLPKERYRTRPSCFACKQDHRIFYCPKFKEMKPRERLRFVKERRLCENCLFPGHEALQCKRTTRCSVPGCGKKHTKFLHMDEEQRGSIGEVSAHDVEVRCANSCTDVEVFMPVVKVDVNAVSHAHVLLDSGSTNSFCTRRLIDKLGVSGREVKFVLSTLEGSGEKRTEVVDLRVMSMDGREYLDLCHVFVVDEIPVKSAAIDVNVFRHLRGLPLVTSVDKVDILIGQDHAEALVPLDVRKGGKHEPHATLTLLGWSLNGVAKGGPASRRAISNFVSSSSLEDKVRSLWEIENEGIVREEDSWSKNDKAVVALWDEKCKRVDGHYELPIPWKKDVNLPNNLVMARNRLISLDRSLHKKGLKFRYDQEIRSLVEKGYAEAVPPHEVRGSGKIWYLPHFAVITDKKPDKVRVVFDCAARYQGMSLNSNCLQGPDLNNRLLHVLLRFRENEFAVTGDVEAMYHQVIIPPNDRDALRFLWFDGDGEVCHFRMCRHLFGGIFCSSSSSYALRRILKDCEGVDPVIQDTVLNSFYVDDCLKSVKTVEEAVNVIHGTRTLLSQFGFRLTKFVSNDPRILNEVPKSERAPEVKEFLPQCKSKALGVRWNVSNDTWYFDVQADTESKVTRRHMLSFLASIFDPLGLVSPIVMAGKLLFQESTRLKLSWDEEIPDEIKLRWRLWTLSLQELVRFEIPRCIKPSSFDDAHQELHLFSDASQEGLGCCAYLRCVSPSGEIHVSLIMSKAKLSPLSQQSIPRLELQSALLSARLEKVLRSELHLDLGPSRFWTDSEIVLRYIKNEDKKFHVFVGNRVGEIRRLTDPSQWYHVPGHENPADLVSRKQGSELLESDKWLHGPAFLMSFACDWKVSECNEPLSEGDPEVKGDPNKGHATCLVSVGECNDPIQKLFERYSSWFLLRRAVAWLLRFKAFVRGTDLQRGRLQESEVHDAEHEILKFVQRQSYTKEYVSLSKGQLIPKGSRLKSLDPFVDAKGILRVGGRIRHSTLNEDAKHPIIVPCDHPIALLIVREHHNKAHLGTEWVVSDIRNSFWIPKIRRIVKRVSNGCFTCKRYFAPPCSQKMADLPAERLEAGRPPFYYVGIDCFGPFTVKSGRSNVKRYACLFSCLNTRAVHLEKLRSLDVDSFLNGFRRFVSRRSTPAKVFCDNAGNFVGGKAELERSLKELRRNQPGATGVGTVEWHFNPPNASHMGGLWERMIRTVRKVLVGLVGLDARLNDESLSTLFCEVEMIVNGRPITKVSDSVTDPRALTPNHLLLLREGPTRPPGLFCEADIYRRRWRCVQHLADVFWKRWVREYLPELQRRAKWHKREPGVNVGDLVLITKESTPRGIWPMGIVKEVFPGRDGLVRSAKVRTKSTELVRPIAKLVLLEGSE